MEDLLAYLREVWSPFADLSTFEPFTNQAARKVYDEMRKSEAGTPEELFPVKVFSKDVSGVIKGISLSLIHI